MGAVGAPAEPRGLEQPAVGVVHRARAGERREIGGALLVALRADPARDRAEHERPEDDGEDDAEQQDRRLAGLARAGSPGARIT